MADTAEQRVVVKSRRGISSVDKRIIWILIGTAGSFLLLLLLAYFFSDPDVNGGVAYDDMFLIMALVVPCVIVFFGILTRGDMREAIASTLMISFVLLLLTSIVLPLGSTSGGPVTDRPTLARTLTDSYTGIMAVFIAFYFGAEGAVRVAKALAPGRERDGDHEVDATSVRAVETKASATKSG